MSFEQKRAYERPILKPLSFPQQQPSPLQSDKQFTPQPAHSDPRGWISTTHIFLGTRNRVIPKCWPSSNFHRDPAEIPDNEIHVTPYDRDTAKKHGPDTERGVFSMFEDARGHLEDEPEPPRIGVKRYIPAKTQQEQATSRPGVTLLMLPGMGMPGEFAEPMIEGLIARQQEAGFEIAEVWSLDTQLCGNTSLGNPIGYLYGNEKDITRDIMLFVTAYLPLQARQDLPFELIPRRPSQDNRQPVRSDLHVVAHSLGAQSAMLIAAHAPDLFASLTVFDPAIIPVGKVLDAFVAAPKLAFCTNLPPTHANRASLIATLKASKRTRRWDERIMNIFADHATVPTGEGGLRLKSHPRLEWALYYDMETPTHCHDRFGDIRTPFNAIMPMRPFAVPAKQFERDIAKLTQEKRLTWVGGSVTHQLPCERVEESTDLVAAWLRDVSRRNRPARL